MTQIAQFIKDHEKFRPKDFMARGYGRILTTAKVADRDDIFEENAVGEGNPNLLIIDEYNKTEDLKEQAFDSLMTNILDAFNFNLDPTDSDKLDVLNLRTGRIWDLENFSTFADRFGVNLMKNANYK